MGVQLVRGQAAGDKWTCCCPKLPEGPRQLSPIEACSISSCCKKIGMGRQADWPVVNHGKAGSAQANTTTYSNSKLLLHPPPNGRSKADKSVKRVKQDRRGWCRELQGVLLGQKLGQSQSLELGRILLLQVMLCICRLSRQTFVLQGIPIWIRWPCVLWVVRQDPMCHYSGEQRLLPWLLLTICLHPVVSWPLPVLGGVLRANCNT